MLDTVRIGTMLYCLWLLLSGYYEALLLSFGVVAVVIVIAVSRRMELVDRESYPARLTFAVLHYWAWLVWEIVKSSIDVTRRVLDPKLPISPTLVRVKASQRTALGQVTYANGITLTPGTVTLDVDGDSFEIHALTREAAEVLRDGEMDRRVSAMEGRG